MEYYEDFCDVWIETHQIHKDESQESATPSMVSLFFRLSFLHLPEEDLMEAIDEDGLLDLDCLIETTEDDQTFDVERNLLIDNTTSRQTIEGILSSMNVPCRPFFVEKILNCARDTERERIYESYKVLRMLVRMSVVVAAAAEDEDEEAALSTLYSESDEAETTTMVAASKTAIEKLEMVEIGHQNSSCSICLEDFCLGLRVLKMPCLHVFHSNCIVNWLNKSKFCPLCRLEMK